MRFLSSIIFVEVHTNEKNQIVILKIYFEQ